VVFFKTESFHSKEIFEKYFLTVLELPFFAHLISPN